MANLESLPLELVLPIVKEAAFDWSVDVDSQRLLALSIISPPFHFCATTLLYATINFGSELKARRFLATRDERYVVKSIRLASTFEFAPRRRSDAPDVETAAEIIRVCPELEGLELGTLKLYKGLIHEPNLMHLRHLVLRFVPSTTAHSFAFPSLRTLEVSAGGRFDPTGIIQLLRASSDELSSLRLPPMNGGSEAALAKELGRFAKTLTSLKIDFESTPATCPLSSMFTGFTALRTLDIAAPDLGLLRRLLSQLPKSTLTSLEFLSESPYFLRSYPNSAVDLEAILSLPQLNKLERLELSLLAARGDDSEEMENPPGDEDGRFVECMQRWEAKGLEIEGAYQWGFMSLAERRELELEDWVDDV